MQMDFQQNNGKRTKKSTLLLVLLLLLVTVTVGYAVLSASLNIQGQSTLNPDASWCVGPKCGGETTPIVCPTGEKCTILDCDANPSSCTNIPEPQYCEDQTSSSCTTGAVIWLEGDTVYFKHILAKPGDVFTFTTKYTNGGNITAKVKDIAKSELNATAKKYLTYDVTYSDNSPIVADDELAPGESAVFKVTVTYKSEVTKLPTSEELALINETADGHTGAISLFTVNYEQK